MKKVSRGFQPAPFRDHPQESSCVVVSLRLGALVDLEERLVLVRDQGLLLGPLGLEEVEVVHEPSEERVVEHRVEGAQQREALEMMAELVL
jgi:hypothetical protein